MPCSRQLLSMSTPPRRRPASVLPLCFTSECTAPFWMPRAVTTPKMYCGVVMALWEHVWEVSCARATSHDGDGE